MKWKNTSNQMKIKFDFGVMILFFNFIIMNREKKILEKIQYVEEFPKQFKNPELILEWLNTLLFNLD